MATKTEIANFALSYVGDQPITLFSDANDRARLVTLFYDSARRRALRLHPWNCIAKRASLGLDADPPLWGFAGRFKLPSDFERLSLIRNSGLGSDAGLSSDRGADYEIQAGFIETNFGAPLEIKYVPNETDTTKYDSLLTSVIAYSLALDLVEPLTQSNTKKAELEKSLRFWLKEASRVSGRERAPQGFRDTSWIIARRRGS